MKIEVKDGDVTVSEIFNGIGIPTKAGLFGIAQRDNGLEMMLDGKLVASIEYGPTVRVFDGVTVLEG